MSILYADPPRPPESEFWARIVCIAIACGLGALAALVAL